MENTKLRDVKPDTKLKKTYKPLTVKIVLTKLQKQAIAIALAKA
jgi:hypothetical protein